MNSMDNSVPSEGENQQPSSRELDLDKIENEAYKWVFNTFDTDKLTKDQIIELVKLHMRKHVYQLQFEMVFEKYQGIVPKYEEIARRLDNIEVLKNQASEGKDALIAEQTRVI
jgi:hypothetical protein